MWFCFLHQFSKRSSSVLLVTPYSVDRTTFLTLICIFPFCFFNFSGVGVDRFLLETWAFHRVCVMSWHTSISTQKRFISGHWRWLDGGDGAWDRRFRRLLIVILCETNRENEWSHVVRTDDLTISNYFSRGLFFLFLRILFSKILTNDIHSFWLFIYHTCVVFTGNFM